MNLMSLPQKTLNMLDDTSDQPVDIRNLQLQVGQWSLELFGDNNHNFSKVTGLPRGSENALNGLVEEVGELNAITIQSHQGRRGYDDPDKRFVDKQDAVADILIFLLDYCNREGIDAGQTLQQTWNKVVSKRNLQNWSQVSHDGETISDAVKEPKKKQGYWKVANAVTSNIPAPPFDGLWDLVPKDADPTISDLQHAYLDGDTMEWSKDPIDDPSVVAYRACDTPS